MYAIVELIFCKFCISAGTCDMVYYLYYEQRRDHWPGIQRFNVQQVWIRSVAVPTS